MLHNVHDFLSDYVHIHGHSYEQSTMFPELGFSAVIRDGVYLDMLIARIKTRTFHRFVWTHWEAEASSLPAALRGL